MPAGLRGEAGPEGAEGATGRRQRAVGGPSRASGWGRRARAPRPEEGEGRREEGRSRSRSRPAGRGRWRRDRLRELQLPCGLRNSRGVCRGDAIMASVLAREAADLRRRWELFPAALHPAQSAQTPGTGALGTGAGPVALGLQRAPSPAPMAAEHAHASRSRATAGTPKSLLLYGAPGLLACRLEVALVGRWGNLHFL